MLGGVTTLLGTAICLRMREWLPKRGYLHQVCPGQGLVIGGNTVLPPLDRSVQILWIFLYLKHFNQ